MLVIACGKYIQKVINVITQFFASVVYILDMSAECPLIRVENVNLIMIIIGENVIFCQPQKRVTSF